MKENPSSYPPREIDVFGLITISCCGGLLILLVRGFVFGVNNNLIHLPIIAKLYEEPQFESNTFIQSLRFFSAGPFLLLRGADQYVDARLLFEGLLLFSNILTMYGLLVCARLLGIVCRRDRCLFVVVTVFSQILNGYGFAGRGGLFLNYFTHTEVANGLTLIAFYYAATARLTHSFAINGVVFFTNAFVGVWNAIPLGLIIAALLVRKRLNLRQVVKDSAIGLAIFSIISSPVVVNIVSNPEFGKPITFEYRDFLALFYPYHFLFGYDKISEYVGLLAVTITGLMSYFFLKARSSGDDMSEVFQAGLVGYILVYLIGIAVPYLTGSPLILNLHLLRSSTGIHLLAGLGAGVLAVTWIESPNPRLSRVFGPSLITMLCVSRKLLILAPLVMLAQVATRRVNWSFMDRLDRTRLIPIFVSAALLLIWPYKIWKYARENAATERHVADWRNIGAWARVNSSPNALFLVPIENIALTNLGVHESNEPSEGEEIFEYVSHRQVWVDLKRGAAVLWAPSEYQSWSERISAVLPLAGLDEKLRYARQHGISYVVAECGGDAEMKSEFRAGRLCVFSAQSDVKQAAPGG